jgi:hypothetical protein
MSVKPSAEDWHILFNGFEVGMQECPEAWDSDWEENGWTETRAREGLARIYTYLKDEGFYD